MKTLSPKRRQYLATVSISLIMKSIKILVPALSSITLVFGLILPASVAAASATVSRPDEHSMISTVHSSGTASAIALNAPQELVEPMIAAGDYFMVGLKSDGTVIAMGDNWAGQCVVGRWTAIVQVAADGSHTVGLRADGTLVAVGHDYYGQCDVGDWTDIVQVAAGGDYTVGLKSDGTVVTVGSNSLGECDVGNWTDIVQVAAGYSHTVGLKIDGTVVAAGSNTFGQCNVGGWSDIVQVATSSDYTVGVKSDGTVVAVGHNSCEQCNIGSWTGITQVAAGESCVVGLRADGTAVAVGGNSSGACNVGGWTDIVQVAAGWDYTVGLRSDGTVAVAGVPARLEEEFARWNLYGPKEGYYLTISSTAGGSVAVPGEGMFIRDPGTVTELEAVSLDGELGQPFSKWTGDVGSIAHANAAQTTITMHGDYEITAIFESGWPCFIATAAYGTSMADEVHTLREFRDEYLLTNPVGQAFVDFYYRTSPPVAEFITEHPFLKPIVRALLVPVVAMSAIAVHTTSAEKIATVGLFVLVLVTLTIWTTWRRAGHSEHS